PAFHLVAFLFLCAGASCPAGRGRERSEAVRLRRVAARNFFPRQRVAGAAPRRRTRSPVCFRYADRAHPCDAGTSVLAPGARRELFALYYRHLPREHATPQSARRARSRLLRADRADELSAGGVARDGAPVRVERHL